MAITDNLVLQGTSGRISKQLVIKQYEGGRTVISAFPNMAGIVPSEQQKARRLSFKAGQKLVSNMLKDPAIRAEWQKRCPAGKRVCDVMLSELMRTPAKQT